MHRFLVSAAHKSSGKTTISLGLAAALAGRGLVVQTFKKGPDYIDPIWLGTASGRPCRNLDFYLTGHDELLAEFARHGAGANVCLVEGNKGLYDGLDLTGSNSNAALAHLLGLPVVLVLDARGMTRGIAPLILGYQAFDPSLRIAGVVLNRLGGSRHESKLRAVIEHYTDVPVLGAVHEHPDMAIAERHLGLIPANEVAAARRRISTIAGVIARQLDLGRLLTITATDDTLPAAVLPRRLPSRPGKLRIAIARDQAFGFYYADDLEALEAAGAELVPFSPIRDPQLPNVDGLFIGGGFPECFMQELEANVSMRDGVRGAIEAGMPAYAECGGLMYLARSITWRGASRTMAGVIGANVVMHDKPVGRGYVRLVPGQGHPWLAPGIELAAHEFHYSSIEGLPAGTEFAAEMRRGHGVDGRHDAIVHRNLVASYTHLRSTGQCDWATRFVGYVRRVRSASEPASAPPGRSAATT
ncbi:MAG: cobyrinate a,c-diamide synthase [Betaproteobacteria bacterium]|nr:cobyrinate a,c-diamide synthase [Betaproteobacteria bacterium]